MFMNMQILPNNPVQKNKKNLNLNYKLNGNEYTKSFSSWYIYLNWVFIYMYMSMLALNSLTSKIQNKS